MMNFFIDIPQDISQVIPFLQFIISAMNLTNAWKDLNLKITRCSWFSPNSNLK